MKLSFVMQQMDQQSLSARFLDLSSSCLDGSEKSVAILRLSDGASRVLSASAFKEAMNTFPSVMGDIVAIQPLLKRMEPMKIVYRCHYFVSDNAGRVVCQTGTIAKTPASPASLKSTTIPHSNLTVTWKDSKSSNTCLVASEVHGVNSKLTEATKNIIHYVEAIQSQQTRVMDVELDFSIDENGKIWLLWSGSVSIVKGTTTPQDIGVHQQTVPRKQFPSKSAIVAASPRRRGVRRRIVDSDVLSDRRRRPEFDFQGVVQAVKIHSEKTVIPTCEKEVVAVPRTLSARSKMERNEKCSAGGGKRAARCLLSNGKECAGDFCSIITRDDQLGDTNSPRSHEIDVNGRGEEYSETKGKTGVIMKLFSAQEISVLRRNKGFRKNIIEGQLDKLQDAETMYGGQARERDTAHDERKVLWKSIAKARERSDKCRKRGGEVTNEGIRRQTETSSIRQEGIRRKRGDSTAISDPYGIVTVCSTCFYVYTVLDQAIRILNDKSTSKDATSKPHQAFLASTFLEEHANLYPMESSPTQSSKLPDK